MIVSSPNVASTKKHNDSSRETMFIIVSLFEIAMVIVNVDTLILIYCSINHE